MDDTCIMELCDPYRLPVGQAIRSARKLSKTKPNLAPALGAYVRYLALSSMSDARSIQRALEVLYAISDPRTFAATCRHVKEEGSPTSSAMVRWLEAGTERRVRRFLPGLPAAHTGVGGA